MSLVKEFKAFAIKGNVIDLAVAVVIGAAFTKIVTAIVQGVVMPLVGLVLPGPGWTGYQIGVVKVGMVLGAVVEFLVVALVLFIVVVKVMGALRKKEAAPAAPAAPASKKCPECLEDIPLEARRCRACTSPQPA